MKHITNALKKYATFSGRARRMEFWLFYLFFIVVVYGFTFLGAAMETPILATLGGIAALALFIPYLAVAVRRMHDVNKSGWFMLIPIYNLILFFTKGTDGPNQYGPDPKGGEASDTDTIDG